jgi:ATP-dependent DNA ligase
VADAVRSVNAATALIEGEIVAVDTTKRKVALCRQSASGIQSCQSREAFQSDAAIRHKQMSVPQSTEQPQKPFRRRYTADEMKELRWLRPKLVAQVSFAEWINYGLLRHATFEGLRDDKEQQKIIRELDATPKINK